MLIRWVVEDGKSWVGIACDTSILLDFMRNGDTEWLPDLIRRDFAYPDRRFFPVWRLDGRTTTAEVPDRFQEEAMAYLDRQARFRSRWRAGVRESLKVAWLYDDGHQAFEYIPDFDSLVEVLATLDATPRLTHFEAAYDGIRFFPLWHRSTGYGWNLPPRFVHDHRRYCQRGGFTCAS